jgi:hypothetical protein
MKQTITIRLNNCEQKQVEADVIRGYAIHRDIVTGERWSVTHVKSGLRCGGDHDTLAAAGKYRKLISDIKVNDVRFGELDICTALECVQVAAAQVAKLVDRDPDEYAERARAYAVDTARLWCTTEAT